MSKWIVITSINEPTLSVKKFSNLHEAGWRIVVVGDEKSPKNYSYPNIEFLSVEKQKRLYPTLSKSIPFNHYARKNIGYLYAIRNNAKLVLDTDDDNFPKINFGNNISLSVKGRYVHSKSWINIYSYFSNENIWPRGLPLDYIHERGHIINNHHEEKCHIQQFLADKDPDVDAIFRLIFKKDLSFKNSSPIILSNQTWTPFNSQNTVFFKKCFPLLYLPSFVSFRMTDIWRSFIAQAVRMVIPFSISFMNSTVDQYRNEHDLMKDFDDEVVGYLNNAKIRRVLLEALNPSKNINSIEDAVCICIENLIREGLMKKTELKLYLDWQKEL